MRHCAAGLVLLAFAGPAWAADVKPHTLSFERIDAWRVVQRVDFGGLKQAYPGSQGYDGASVLPYLAWTGGMVRPFVRAHPSLLLRDGLEGEDATLLLGLPDLHTYRLILTLGDAARARGPVDIYVNDELCASGVTTAAGEFVDFTHDVLVMGGHARVRLAGLGCASFAVAAVTVYGEASVPRKLPALFPVAAFEPMEPTRFGIPAARDLARVALKSYAEFLIDNQPPEGGFSYNGAWYECAYPVRSLLLAAAVLDEPRYRDAALDNIDRFVSEQFDDHSWSATYFGKAGCPLSQETRDSTDTRNLADVGSMFLAVSLAAQAADGPRRETYLKAATLFAESRALPAQLESGAFPNLEWQGVTYSHPYSVATGVQASGLAGLYAITGEERYRAAAERAGLFLARSVLGPGQIRFHAHDREEPLIHGPERMGELFYLLEGMIWSARCSGPEASQEISDALQRFLSEVRDSFLETSAQEWVAQGSTWEMSKRAGLLYLLVQMEALSAQDPTEISDGLLACLSNSLCSVRAGVLCNPAAPKGRFALVATGFAGLGMASLVELEALFPERLRRPSR